MPQSTQLYIIGFLLPRTLFCKPINITARLDRFINETRAYDLFISGLSPCISWRLRHTSTNTWIIQIYRSYRGQTAMIYCVLIQCINVGIIRQRHSSAFNLNRFIAELFRCRAKIMGICVVQQCLITSSDVAPNYQRLLP